MKKDHILVIGSGIIGNTSTLHLQQNGFQVTNVSLKPNDLRDTATVANGCRIVHHYQPKSWLQLISHVFRKDININNNWKRASSIRIHSQLSSFVSKSATLFKQQIAHLNLSHLLFANQNHSDLLIDAHELNQKIKQKATDLGAQYIQDEIIRFVHDKHGAITHAIGQKKAYPAKKFIIAAGLQSNQIAKRSHVHLPLFPIYGYSVSAKILGPPLPKGGHVTSLGNFISFGNSVRFVYGADFQRTNRYSWMTQKLKQMYPNCSNVRTWSGTRSATPDLAPIIDQIAPNLYVNVGHGSLGLTTCFASAIQLFNALHGDEILFSSNRFQK